MAIKISYPVKYLDYIKSECKKNDVEVTLILAMIKTESGFNPNAKSKAGAMGLMQLMPATAKYVCEKTGMEYDEERLFEPAYNIALGVYYTRYLLDRFEKSDAIAAYNAGEGSVRKWLSEKRTEYGFKETRDYVKKVETREKGYKRYGRVLMRN